MTDHPQNKIEQALHDQFGIKNVTLHYGLSQDELLFAAIEIDRGRVTLRAALMNKRLTNRSRSRWPPCLLQ